MIFYNWEMNMKMENKLPVVKKRKKIDIKKFVALAKKVRKSFEEEARYLEKSRYKDEYNLADRLLRNN